MIAQTARNIRRLIISLTVITLAGCASSGSVSERQQVATKSSSADRAVAVAMQQVGVPYQFGGSTPRGFDCSGLVHYSYAQVGRSVPRTTATLWSGLRPISRSDMQVGDVLFFEISGKMSHVGLYIGRDQFVHAPSSGKSVSVDSLRSSFYSRAFVRAGRPN